MQTMGLAPLLKSGPSAAHLQNFSPEKEVKGNSWGCQREEGEGLAHVTLHHCSWSYRLAEAATFTPSSTVVQRAVDLVWLSHDHKTQ